MNNSTNIPVKYYKSITDTPLCNYIDCLIEKNLAYLVISGEPDRSVLEEVWESMLQEYADAMGDEAYDLYLTCLKELTILELRLNMVHSGVTILKMLYDKTYADKINEILRTSFKFDWTDQGTYQAELTRCLNRSKSIEIQIQLKQSQLKAQQEKFTGEAKKPTREYFQSLLITLSDHSKYEIKDTITVYQFLDRIRRFNAYCKQAGK